MTNLYDETINSLKSEGKSMDDIVWVGCDDFAILLEDFIEVAKQTDYDDTFGCQHIATDLKIVGKDFVMLRKEYDGAEWWEYISFIHPIPSKTMVIKRLEGEYEPSLGQLNK